MISFKGELLLTDIFLYEIAPRRSADDQAEGEDNGVEEDDLCASSRQERNLKINGALFVEGDALAFASRHPATRQRTLYALYRIMRGWTKMPKMSERTEKMAQRLVGPELDEDELDNIEYRLAYHYIITFSDFFKRAPILPHCI